MHLKASALIFRNKKVIDVEAVSITAAFSAAIIVDSKERASVLPKIFAFFF
jgi:hypothetical protein